MNLLSAKEIAEIWGVSQRRVAILCAEGRIEGAEMVGNMWVIPKDAKKPNDGRKGRVLNDGILKPFVKWAGGKSQLLSAIRNFYPDELGKSIRKYAEPFVGGGAILFDVLNHYNLDNVYISDTNAELINTYIQVRDNVSILIEQLHEYEAKFLPSPNELRKKIYYEKRERYNELKSTNHLNEECAALFIFLNRTCFNGLYRVNSKGQYNVPMGAYSNPQICDENNLTMASKALNGVTIKCADYIDSADFIGSDTFVYFDPPYRPLTETSSFTSYTAEPFNDDSQRRLAAYIRALSEKGNKVVASNSDPKNTDPEDNFFDDLYKGFNIQRISASRMINSKSNGRGKISELLISNY